MEKVSRSIFGELYDNTTAMMSKLEELLLMSADQTPLHFPDIGLDVLKVHRKELEKIYEAGKRGEDGL